MNWVFKLQSYTIIVWVKHRNVLDCLLWPLLFSKITFPPVPCGLSCTSQAAPLPSPLASIVDHNGAPMILGISWHYFVWCFSHKNMSGLEFQSSWSPPISHASSQLRSSFGNNWWLSGLFSYEALQRSGFRGLVVCCLGEGRRKGRGKGQDVQLGID